MNKLFQELQTVSQNPNPQSQNNVNTDQLKSMAAEFRNTPNKAKYLQDMIMNNPKMQNIAGLKDLMSGKINVKNLFYQQARARGIDPDWAANLLGLK